MQKNLLKFGIADYFLYLCNVEVWKSFLRKLNIQITNLQAAET
jgi:hypothetical protein